MSEKQFFPCFEDEIFSKEDLVKYNNSSLSAKNFLSINIPNYISAKRIVLCFCKKESDKLSNKNNESLLILQICNLNKQNFYYLNSLILIIYIFGKLILSFIFLKLFERINFKNIINQKNFFMISYFFFRLISEIVKIYILFFKLILKMIYFYLISSKGNNNSVTFFENNFSKILFPEINEISLGSKFGDFIILNSIFNFFEINIFFIFSQVKKNYSSNHNMNFEKILIDILIFFVSCIIFFIEIPIIIFIALCFFLTIKMKFSLISNSLNDLKFSHEIFILLLKISSIIYIITQIFFFTSELNFKGTEPFIGSHETFKVNYLILIR